MHKTLMTLALALGGAALTAAAPADDPETGELTVLPAQALQVRVK